MIDDYSPAFQRWGLGDPKWSPALATGRVRPTGGQGRKEPSIDLLTEDRPFVPEGLCFLVIEGPSVKTLGYPQGRLFACEEAIRAMRFRQIELVATLPGVPFYRAFDYGEGERYEVPLVNGLSLPVVRMSKNL